ncbi:MAG: hypothetical protein EVJ46_07785 [Candidatus Acididesulfobacter guangdongensis]|uniref:Uncharacterized protein n=1 Tax=Acididesulfobacter guangdongensis TaxID=2597225 RepID=A0A519BFN6_ACIG2|nr:MAG: hypothetical protein EVJ46_07785 [Candidatus Acididesulfobacter guangdongensis]
MQFNLRCSGWKNLFLILFVFAFVSFGFIRNSNAVYLGSPNNDVSHAEAFAEQIEQYARQGLQYAAEAAQLKAQAQMLASNPGEVQGQLQNYNALDSSSGLNGNIQTQLSTSLNSLSNAQGQTQALQEQNRLSSAEHYRRQVMICTVINKLR